MESEAGPAGAGPGEGGAPMYHRVLLKLSGEAFSPADSDMGIDTASTGRIAAARHHAGDRRGAGDIVRDGDDERARAC